MEQKPGLAFSELGADHGDILARVHAEIFAKPWPEREFCSLLSGHGMVAVAVSLNHCSDRADRADPAGFCILRCIAGVAEIITFGVVETFRCQGVGSTLLSAALEQAAARGCVRSFLEVAEDNQAARQLYDRLGFSDIGRRAGYYRRPGGVKVDAIVLWRPLEQFQL